MSQISFIGMLFDNLSKKNNIYNLANAVSLPDRKLKSAGYDISWE
jgi:hypothetical protein